MNILELLIFIASAAVVIVILGWFAHLAGIPPWIMAVPIVLGLRFLWGGGWITVGVALAIGVSLALLVHLDWYGVMFYSGLAFYIMRRYDLWKSEKRSSSGVENLNYQTDETPDGPR